MESSCTVAYISYNNLKQNKRSMSSQWTNAGPNNVGVGGRTRALLVQPGTNPFTMYVGCVAGGVWKSVDGGNSWSPLTDMMANIAIGSLAATSDFSAIYAGTGEGYLNVDAERGAGIFVTYNGTLHLFVPLPDSFRFALQNEMNQGVERISEPLLGFSWTNVVTTGLHFHF